MKPVPAIEGAAPVSSTSTPPTAGGAVENDSLNLAPSTRIGGVGLDNGSLEGVSSTHGRNDNPPVNDVETTADIGANFDDESIQWAGLAAAVEVLSA